MELARIENSNFEIAVHNLSVDIRCEFNGAARPFL